jgi:hypothetical protein
MLGTNDFFVVESSGVLRFIYVRVAMATKASYQWTLSSIHYSYGTREASRGWLDYLNFRNRNHSSLEEI